jgi:hypothetical protein
VFTAQQKSTPEHNSGKFQFSTGQITSILHKKQWNDDIMKLISYLPAIK